MIVTLIVVCEVGFWVLLAAGLAVRYVLKRRRAGAALLLCVPLLEAALFVATAADLKNGATPGWEHGLAALYLGFTVAYGPRLIRWLDGHAAHRLAGGPPPSQPPRYGRARARHEARLWLRAVLGAAVALVLLELAVLYVGDDGDVGALRTFQWVAVRAVGVYGLIVLSYLLFPKKAPAADTRQKGDRTLTER
ncbi:hypothetical protein [Streptomyces sp. NPDC047079]|uniref:hypothetical protein n=1 Tax=Streptomyces sp. NPDC047079 TaxID=3154607 RepID=UPI0034043F45